MLGQKSRYPGNPQTLTDGGLYDRARVTGKIPFDCLMPITEFPRAIRTQAVMLGELCWRHGNAMCFQIGWRSINSVLKRQAMPADNTRLIQYIVIPADKDIGLGVTKAKGFGQRLCSDMNLMCKYESATQSA